VDIVIDTSAVMAVIIGEPERQKIIEITVGHSLVAPGSIPWEVGNAFSAMFKKGSISREEALKGVGIFETIPIRFLKTDIENSLRLAHRYGLYAYDAYVIECAIQFAAPLLTLDRSLMVHGQEAGVAVLEV
jgi:predicted nucleic acid-binding protein